MTIEEISPTQAAQLIKEGWKLVDVRTPGEWNKVHAAEAVNVPLQELSDARLKQAAAEQNIVFICHSGARSRQACELFASSDIRKIFNLAGGTQAWEAAGLAVVKGQGCISLDRQVRIAAGLLVLLGTLLGIFMHPYWLGLPIFVGAGLIFAGVTDRCGMTSVLAKMPWNQ